MQQRLLAVTVDYEIFGNGSGDVLQHVIEPTERMARVCERHGVPLVVYFEVEEYLAFERYAGELKRDLGYDPAERIREQIRSLVLRGHDIQLHLHPEWVGARYVDRRWVLRPEMHTVAMICSTVKPRSRLTWRNGRR